MKASQNLCIPLLSNLRDMKTMNILKAKERFFEKDFFVLDTETTPFTENKKVEFIFGVIYGHNHIEVIHSKEDLKKELLKPIYKKKKVFAHNAEFDLNVIYGNVYLLDSKAIFNGRFICATNGNCLFADSFNIFSTSVETIGRTIGKEKKNLSKDFWEKSIVTDDDIEYCIRDCEIIFDALLQIFDMVGNSKITLAGLSLDMYRRKYQPFHIDYNDALMPYFFNSYYGGRTEAFYIGKTNACCYDVNSMYPYAMKNCIFPNPKYLQHKKNLSVDTFLNKYLKRYEGVANIEIKHGYNYFGHIPVRKNNKLCFPVGQFSGWYNFNELRYAIDNGIINILSVTDIVYSQRMASPFKNFVDETFAKKQENSNEFSAYMFKIILNSLYGKFAQKIDTEFIYIENMRSIEGYNTIEHYKQLGVFKKLSLFNERRNDCFIEIGTGCSKTMYHTIPLFSSYITSFARVMLLDTMVKTVQYEPLYCDTDSIFYKKDPCIAQSKKLGAWKKENKIITEIRGLKNYDYISVNILSSRIKGIPKNADKINTNTFTYETLVKAKESLRRGIPATTLVKRQKIIVGRYDKRNVLPNGNTEPLLF